MDGGPELAGLGLHYAGVFAGVHPAVLADEIGEEIDQVVARGAVAVEVGREAHPKLFFGGFTLEDGDKDIFRGDSLECFFHDDLFLRLFFLKDLILRFFRVKSTGYDWISQALKVKSMCLD